MIEESSFLCAPEWRDELCREGCMVYVPKLRPGTAVETLKSGCRLKLKPFQKELTETKRHRSWEELVHTSLSH